MNDLISRQEAIAYACSGLIRRMDDEDWRKVKEIREDLKAVPPTQQWIPCSERLPKPWKSVLVTYIYNGKRFVEESQYTGQYDEQGNPLFSSYSDEYKVSGAYFQMIAWMPFPEPYKEETHEAD